MSPEIGTVVWIMWAEEIGPDPAKRATHSPATPGLKLVEKADDHFDGPYADGIATLVHGE